MTKPERPSRRDLIALSATASAGALRFSQAAAQETAQAGPMLQGAGRAAVVAGSLRGIGAVTAGRLARDGYAVTVNCLFKPDLTAQVLADTEAEGVRATWLQADVADPEAVRALFDVPDAAFGDVDLVIGNAGIMNVAPCADFTDEAFDRIIATNLKGGFNILREASRRVPDGGRIICLSSISTLARRAGQGPYAATKITQEAYAGTLVKELSSRRGQRIPTCSTSPSSSARRCRPLSPVAGSGSRRKSRTQSAAFAPATTNGSIASLSMPTAASCEMPPCIAAVSG